MSENFNSHIACEGTDNDINWVCKVCKDLPNYAGMYLYQREREKNQLKNVKDRRADLILLKYYYALLHLLDKIHELHECPNPENDVPKYADRKCSTPECFVYYRYIYNTYASILMTEKGLNQINLRCDICSVLPYTIFSDLEMIAKNMHSDDMEKTQKLEIEAVIADYYLEAVGSCEQWDECPSGVDWLELIKSVQLLRKYLEKKDRKELQISLNEWNRVRSIDNILNTEIKTTCRDFQTKNIPLCVLEKKTLVCLFLMKLLYPHMVKFYSFIDFSTYVVQGSTNYLTHYLKAFIAAGIRNRIIALYDNDSAGLSEIKVLKNIPIPSNVRIMHLPDLEMCLHYPTIGPGGSSIDNINGRACSIEMFLGKDILKKSGEYEPVRWKSYIDKVDAYQGEIVSKSEVLKQFKLKVKRSQDQLVLDEWEECDLLLREIFAAFEK